MVSKNFEIKWAAVHMIIALFVMVVLLFVAHEKADITDLMIFLGVIAVCCAVHSAKD